jgi:hypothetical protein
MATDINVAPDLSTDSSDDEYDPPSTGRLATAVLRIRRKSTAIGKQEA